MASRYFGIEMGKTFDDVTQGSSTTSKTVEIVVDLADGATREQVLLAIEQLEMYITKNTNWPPA